MAKLKFVALVSIMLFVTLPAVSASDNAGSRLGAPQNSYAFSIGPGGSWSTASSLDGYAPGYYDRYVMTVTSGSAVTIHVVDCCMEGDTMVIKSKGKTFRFTSPAEFLRTVTLRAGTYTFYIGYTTPHTGVFPAGYDIYVSAEASRGPYTGLDGLFT